MSDEISSEAMAKLREAAKRRDAEDHAARQQADAEAAEQRERAEFIGRKEDELKEQLNRLIDRAATDGGLEVAKDSGRYGPIYRVARGRTVEVRLFGAMTGPVVNDGTVVDAGYVGAPGGPPGFNALLIERGGDVQWIALEYRLSGGVNWGKARSTVRLALPDDFDTPFGCPTPDSLANELRHFGRMHIYVPATKPIGEAFIALLTRILA